ncbi:hypothetical protein [Streptomyces sp. NPDC057302]|uniref:hypothetical protein n=1 Tax=Streptomyces sp. NPDC057302 TaxID=3346094 RepID=UPI0036372A89
MPADKTPLTLDPARDPWDQQPRESDANFRRFEAYLKMRDRKVRTLAAELTRSVAYMQQLAYRMHWHERAKAYDVETRRKEADALDAARRSHAKQMVAATGLAVRQLVKGLQQEREYTTNELIKLYSVLRPAVEGTRLNIGGIEDGPAVKVTAVPASDTELRAEVTRLVAQLDVGPDDPVTIDYDTDDEDA